MRLKGLTFLFVLALLSGGVMVTCTTAPSEPDFVSEFIVNAYLTVGAPLDTVFVSRSVSLDAPYSRETAGVSADSVILTAGVRAYHLSERGFPGAYVLEGDSVIVEAGVRYSLAVYIDGSVIRAQTTAPDQVRITAVNQDSGYFPYPDPDLSEKFRVSWDAAAGAAAYEISVIAHPPYDIVDFGLDRFIEHALEMNDYDTLATFPPVLDFPVADSEGEVEISWDAFIYYGDYTLKVYAADQNLWDLAASSVIYMPQSSEYEQPNFNIEGGLGIFSAVSVDSVRVTVLKQE